MKNLFIIIFSIIFFAKVEAQSNFKYDSIFMFELLENVEKFIDNNNSKTYNKMVSGYLHRQYPPSQSDSLIINMAFKLIFDNRKKYIERYVDFTTFYMPYFTKNQFDEIYQDLKTSSISKERKRKIYPYDYFISECIVSDSLEDVLFLNLANNLKHSVDYFWESFEAEGNLICHAINQGNKQIESRFLKLIERDFKVLESVDWNNFEDIALLAVYLRLFHEIYSPSFWKNLLRISLPIASKHSDQSISFYGNLRLELERKLKSRSFEDFDDKLWDKKLDIRNKEYYKFSLQFIIDYINENPNCWVYLMDKANIE